MQFRQTILSLFLVFNLAQALPTSASTSVVDISKRANNKGGGGGKGGKGGVSAEVKGINKNIGIQKQEKQDAKAVSAAETGGKAQFGKAKGQLLDTIEKGEKVRANNQKLADKNNKPLVDGLKKVSRAEKKKLLYGWRMGITWHVFWGDVLTFFSLSRSKVHRLRRRSSPRVSRAATPRPTRPP